ncbi:PRLI-interacting factor [Parasponia andersonii]|uniref:PRLI-interacting factor n=1 Tax=Parasponia andersonii TaxID=3476 RepID=A0A2P5BJ43_PARAD|nr:PRLI-interacting factor [Parasponia andersonii]
MNDQSQMMNQAQMMSQPHIMSQPQMMSQMPQSSQPQLMSQTQAMAAQPQQPQLMMMSNQSQPPMMSRGGGYKAWPQQPSMDPSKKFQNSSKPNFVARNNNWKGKKGTDKRQDPRRLENLVPNASMSGQTSSGGGGGGGYKPPTLHELQSQNRLKARKFYHPKKKFNNRFAPYAPRNTTSFIIRAKKSGGIASLVSPCPVTPAVLPTPIFSPSREVLGDMAKEEWGVDGYGSMKGLIRLRSPGNDEEDDEEGGGGSSESDVEEHVEVERRLDHDLSRFEMIYPNYSGTDYNNVLENRVDDQDTHIAQLEEENLTLKERLFLMERDLGDLRRRLQFLERQNDFVREVREEVVENESENESEGGSGAPDMCLSGKNNDGVVVEYTSGQEGSRDVEGDSKKDHDDGAPEIERAGDVSMEDFGHGEVIVREKNDVKDEEAKKHNDMTVDKDEKAKTDEVADEVLAREAKPTLVEREVNAEKKDEVDITFSEKSIGDGD